GDSNNRAMKEASVYAAIRQGKAKTGMAEELARRIKEDAIPIISDVEGFMAYYVVYAADDTALRSDCDQPRPHQLSQSAARTQLPRTALQPSGRRSDCLVPPARLSQGRIPKLVRRTALAQEVKKFDAFAQASLHHLRAADHFADNRGDFAGAQIEAPIELLDRIEDFGVAQMRIM